MQIVEAQMLELIQGVLGAFPYAEAAAGEAEGAGLSFNLFWILISAANFGSRGAPSLRLCPATGQ